MTESLPKPRKRRLLVVTLGAVLSVFVGYGFLTGYLPIRMFDSQQWKMAHGKGDDTRIQMIEHLTASGRLDGATRAEVLSILGPADETNYFADYDMVYWLGSERGLISIDSEWLVIKLGPSGVVSDYRVLSD